MLKRIIHTSNAKTVMLIRLMIGAVFLSEGLQKFLFPDTLGTGRFVRIGLPFPGFLGYFVGSFETVCGMLILAGFLTRLASIPTIIIMLVAISTTKVPILQQQGFWQMLHDSRTDWAMLLGSIFLLINGAGRYSADHLLTEKNS
jgi:putative oxidoreductase